VGAEVSRQELKMLERMFTAEVEHALSESRLPHCYQSKAKVIQTLREKNMIEAVSFKVGHDALACTVSGYVLTHYGRMIYCASC